MFCLQNDGTLRRSPVMASIFHGCLSIEKTIIRANLKPLIIRKIQISGTILRRLLGRQLGAENVNKLLSDSLPFTSQDVLRWYSFILLWSIECSWMCRKLKRDYQTRTVVSVTSLKFPHCTNRKVLQKEYSEMTIRKMLQREEFPCFFITNKEIVYYLYSKLDDHNNKSDIKV